MYLNAGSTLFAVNAVTGESVWTLTMDDQLTARGRGPAYGDGRVYAFGDATMYAADGRTGELVESFGDAGRLDIISEALQFQYPDAYPPGFDAATLGYQLTTPPVYFDDTLYAGVALSENHIPGGLVIAADAATGAIKWVFNTVPQGPRDDGWEIAKDTWGYGQKVGGGIWTPPAIDPDLGLLYVNAGNPSPDYDGSARLGMNLFTNATVALHLETGKLAWYYQTIHHDLWDWDHVTGPLLFDVTRDGQTVKGVAAAGKNCLMYIWDRATGEPLNPMVETAVPTETDVPGDEVWPTQPIPYTARGVPMEPFCATYPIVEDPALADRARPMYTPFLVSEMSHRDSRRLELGTALVQSAHRAAVRHREERGDLVHRQAGRRYAGAEPALRGAFRKYGGDGRSGCDADEDAVGLRPRHRRDGLAANAAYHPSDGDHRQPRHGR